MHQGGRRLACDSPGHVQLRVPSSLADPQANADELERFWGELTGGDLARKLSHSDQGTVQVFVAMLQWFARTTEDVQHRWTQFKNRFAVQLEMAVMLSSTPQAVIAGPVLEPLERWAKQEIKVRSEPPRRGSHC